MLLEKNIYFDIQLEDDNDIALFENTLKEYKLIFDREYISQDGVITYSIDTNVQDSLVLLQGVLDVFEDWAFAFPRLAQGAALNEKK